MISLKFIGIQRHVVFFVVEISNLEDKSSVAVLKTLAPAVILSIINIFLWSPLERDTMILIRPDL